MAGYSGTPLPKKLGIKPGTRLGLVGAPDDFAETLGELPDDVAPRRVVRDKTQFDVIVCFARSSKELARNLTGASGAARARQAASGSPGPRSRQRGRAASSPI